jgi:hypothetical protein
MDLGYKSVGAPQWQEIDVSLWKFFTFVISFNIGTPKMAADEQRRESRRIHLPAQINTGARQTTSARNSRYH